jgi:hypothetical protein
VDARREKLLPIESFTASDRLPSNICVSLFALAMVLVPLVVLLIIDLPRLLEDLRKAKRNILASTRTVHPTDP